jgi:hypothetical protein
VINYRVCTIESIVILTKSEVNFLVHGELEVHPPL